MLKSKKNKNIQTESLSTAQQAYINNYNKNVRRIKIYQVLIFVVFVLQWQICSSLRVIDPFIFSSPKRLVSCFIDMTKGGVIYYHIGVTLLETFLSFTLVILIGLLVAIILWWNHSVSKVLEPYLVILNSLPKSALAPLFIVWLGNNIKTIIVAAVSVAVFGTMITLYTNFKNVEEDKIKLIRTLGGNKKDILFKVVLPSNLPSIISVMKVNIGLSLVGVVIGEFLAAKAGLGYLIIYGSQVFKLDWVLMSIVILCIMATLLYLILGAIEKRFK